MTSSLLGPLLLWVLFIGVLFVLPLWLLATGIARLRSKQRGMIRLSIGIAMLLFALFALDSFFGPWHEKILDQGTAPDGRAYVLLQVKDDPFGISLFVRNEETGWVFHYVDHEVFPWRTGGHVEFAPDSATARVFQGSKVYRTIDILPPEETVPAYKSFSPTNSPEDILRFNSTH